MPINNCLGRPSCLQDNPSARATEKTHIPILLQWSVYRTIAQQRLHVTIYTRISLTFNSIFHCGYTRKIAMENIVCLYATHYYVDMLISASRKSLPAVIRIYEQ
jgi:hypothetical protein